MSKTAPYMHDGSEKTLEDVITYYDNGGLRNPWSDPQLLEPGKTKLGLTDQEKKDLVAFLKALDGAPIKIEAPQAARMNPTALRRIPHRRAHDRET